MIWRWVLPGSEKRPCELPQGGMEGISFDFIPTECLHNRSQRHEVRGSRSNWQQVAKPVNLLTGSRHCLCHTNLALMHILLILIPHQLQLSIAQFPKTLTRIPSTLFCTALLWGRGESWRSHTRFPLASYC